MAPQPFLEQLVEDYSPLVVFVARQLQKRLPASVELDDLISAGFLGQLSAIERFDPGAEVKFRTYAEHRIRGAMLDDLRAMDAMPRSLRDLAKKIDVASTSLKGVLGREPSSEEVASALGIPLERYHAIRGSIGSGVKTASLDAGPSSEIANADDPLGMVTANASREDLIAAIDRLPEDGRLVLSLYYFEELNLQEIGAVMGVSESRVSQIKTASLERIRGILTRSAG